MRTHDDRTATDTPIAGLFVRALGPLVLDHGGSEVVLPRRKARELFLYLVLNRGKHVRAGAISEALWEGRAPPGDIHAVRSYVSMIRSTIDGRASSRDRPIIRGDSGTYTLTLDDDQIDFVRFETLVARGDRAIRGGFYRQALRDIEHALSFTRGAPLADVAGRAFASSEIARLVDLEAEARETRALALLEMGHPEQAVADLTGLTDQHPLRERTASLLMVGLYRLRRQVEALAAAQTFYRRHRQEYGAVPSPAFSDLEMGILSQASELDGAAGLEGVLRALQSGRASTAAPARPRIDTTRRRVRHTTQERLHGRSDDAQALLSRVLAARDVAIVGPAGCGKSALSRRVASTYAARTGSRVEHHDLSTAGALERLRDQVRARTEQQQYETGERIVVLDQAEVLHGQVDPVAREILSNSPAARVVRTSRRRDQPHSDVFELSPLPDAPETERVETLLDAPAVTLFWERARRSRRSLEPDSTTLRSVARLCNMLDGLPLAIVIAADQTNAMAPPELDQRFSTDLRLAFECRSRRGEHDPDLQTAYQRSVVQLTDAERRAFLAFAQLGHRPAAQQGTAVVGSADITVDALASLAAHNLVCLDDRGATPRYSMLNTWRAFALLGIARSVSVDVKRIWTSWHRLRRAAIR